MKYQSRWSLTTGERAVRLIKRFNKSRNYKVFRARLQLLDLERHIEKIWTKFLMETK